MDHTHNGQPKQADYSAPREVVADILAAQVPALQQQVLALQIEVAHRDRLLAAKDAELATLKAIDANIARNEQEEVFSS